MGRVFDFDHRLLMQDGSVKYVHVAAHALRDEAGSVEFAGAVTDITDPGGRKKRCRGARDFWTKHRGS